MSGAARMRESADVPLRRRVVLLGASNAARGIAAAVQAARAACGGPFDLMAAMGHGRSYGRGSWVLGRWLPGILQCRLWDDLAAREALPTLAVLTDVGNDILYGAPSEKISAWVCECVQRLARHDCRTVITGIPLASIALMRRWEFPLFRSILFPNSRVSFDEALRRACEVDEHLRSLAEQHHCNYLQPEAQWYGHDRIHIVRSQQAAAWRLILARLSSADLSADAPPTTSEFYRIRLLTPYYRRVFGIPQGRPQPAARLRDGTAVSLY